MSKSRFHMGTPKGSNRGQLEEYNYTISKNLDYYRLVDQNTLEHDISEFEFMNCEIFDRYAKDTF